MKEKKGSSEQEDPMAQWERETAQLHWAALQQICPTRIEVGPDGKHRQMLLVPPDVFDDFCQAQKLY